MGIFPSNLPLESSPRILPSIFPSNLPLALPSVLPSIYPSKLPSHISSMSTLNKQTSRSRKACQGNDPWTKIVDAAHDLRIIRNLSNAHIRRVAVATEVLQQEQNSPKRQKYQLFLYNVLRKCGPHAVLVCAIALSQRLVFEMKNNDRKTLVNILEKNKDLQAIIQRSDQNCIRQSSPAISTSCTNTVSLNDTQSGSIATSESPLNTPSCARLEQHLVLEKAAVTMDFPPR